MDAVVRLAAQWLRADVTMLTFFDTAADRVYFKAQQGLAEPWASNGQMRLAASVCEPQSRSQTPIVVPDTSRHPVLANAGIARTMGIHAYLGVPVFGLADEPVGALCLLSAHPRGWDTQEIASLKDLALIISEQVRARMEAHRQMSEPAALAGAQAIPDQMVDLAHELRTPLNALLGAAEALVSFDAKDIRQDMVGLMSRAGHQLHAFADDVTALALVEAGTLVLADEPFRPDTLVRETVALVELAGVPGSDGVQIVGSVGAAQTVAGDPRRVCQVVANLVANALEHAGSAPVTIGIDVADGEDATRRRLTITVADSGPGVPDGEKATIFERFYRSAASARSRRTGSGLGLSIARTLCRRHGGDLRVGDTPGGGATFVATFAVTVPEA
ncbi:MAG: GAF domain-containing sensor histidine kinase [Alphaproteobacteria bacterium]|nr:GAF domain-containing sensor histidine kinase [Alphaproteobacteria bacterium]MCB9929903.1 GAF domain-containing sensor histidine kinase [Alphaproteobacteria bacterium]